jgi:sucrose-6-phosphate hydrolase SacC (GH32 family)
MWYIFGTKWIPAMAMEPVARVYKIGHATSNDGIVWKKEDGRQIIKDVLNENECQALPTVIKTSERYHMFFCFREATDFRKNPERSYKLGYAYSDDLITWIRNDDKAGITPTKNEWDSDMMCYPHLFQIKNKIYLLYNGNEFGKYGFGLAELESEI